MNVCCVDSGVCSCAGPCLHWVCESKWRKGHDYHQQPIRETQGVRREELVGSDL